MAIQLTALEKELVDACRKGLPLIVSANNPSIDDPANSANWSIDRSIRAEVVSALCLQTNKEWPVSRGIRIKGVKITGALNFDDSIVEHGITFDYCKIEEPISMRFSKAFLLDFTGSHTNSIYLERMTLQHNLILAKCVINGEIALRQAIIKGQVHADEMTINANNQGNAIRGDGVSIYGDLFLRKCTVDGPILLQGSNIGGNIECDESTFNNPSGITLNLGKSVIGGSLFLRGKNISFTSSGEVSLLDCQIGSELDCSNAKITNLPRKNHLSIGAITCDRIRVKGSVFFTNGFKSIGSVRITSATIGSNLEFTDGEIINPNNIALMALDLKVNGTLILCKMRSKPIGKVILEHAEVRTFFDDMESWPQQDELLINGFKYGEIGYESPTSADKRLKWLKLQPSSTFRPQPYEQIIKVLRHMGYENAATSIAIEKQKRLYRSGMLQGWSAFWNELLGMVISRGVQLFG